jgi:hypothetical protein
MDWVWGFWGEGVSCFFNLFLLKNTLESFKIRRVLKKFKFFSEIMLGLIFIILLFCYALGIHENVYFMVGYVPAQQAALLIDQKPIGGINLDPANKTGPSRIVYKKTLTNFEF